MRSGHILAESTSSSISIERIRDMVYKCEREHATCGPGRQQILPRRLVDLSSLDHDGSDGVQFIEFTGSTDVRGSYACLSHCWGKETMPVTTINENIHENMEYIALELLPTTFRDAITITRSLGLRYIWIDSLCIIQSSEEDWQVESTKMATIYQNSFVTIAATSSSDFKGGCFAKREGDMCFHVKYGTILDTTLGVRAEVEVEFSQLYPLFTRGWVYQEHMLSGRLLYCNRNEFELECREG
ncbi:HET-domain-containing protein [Camillea tinctor]|nr:HET-domain-containing protein [Camillea tinctor]